MPTLDGAAAIAGILALILTSWQVMRDLLRVRSEELAQARKSKLIIGALYASFSVEIRELVYGIRDEVRVGSAGRSLQAQSLARNEHFQQLYGKLLDLDGGRLPNSARPHLERAQRAAIAIRNKLMVWSRGERPVTLAQEIESNLAVIRKSYEEMRSFAPYDVQFET